MRTNRHNRLTLLNRALRGTLLVALGGSALAAAVDRNAAFRDHLKTYAAEHPLAVARIQESWQAHYQTADSAFIPDSLAVLFKPYAAALTAFERRDYETALTGFESLAGESDPYLSTNARYFQLRTLVALQRYEAAEDAITKLLDAQPQLGELTPYAPHLRMLLAHCQARDLRPASALATLETLLTESDALPEAVLVSARQLMLELQRQGDAPLEQVERLMQYVATRLEAIDTSQRTRDRQQEIIDLLDKMIEEQEQQEQQQQSGGGSSQQQSQAPTPQPQQSQQHAQRSDERSGQGDIGDLHDSPTAKPGEAWGELPPAERERILQDLRERYPTRYRQLVEQYYRALAEEE